MKKKYFLLILIIVNSLFINLNAQTSKIDSLKNLLQQHKKKDTIRINLLNKISFAYLNTDLKKSLNHAKIAKEYSNKLNYTKGKAESLHIIFRYHHKNSDYPNALEALKKYYIELKKLGNKPDMAKCLNNIGAIYLNQGNYPKALEYLQKSLSIKKEIGNKEGIAISLSNIGVIYRNNSEYSTSLEYYLEALQLCKEIGDEDAIADNYNNIGIIYRFKNNFPKALEYYQKCLDMKYKLDKKQGIALSLNNIGLIKMYQGNYPDAFYYSKKSLEIRLELGDKYEICRSYENLGAIYLKTNKYDKALSYTLKSLEIAKNMEILIVLEALYEQISEIYYAKRNYKKAYENYVKYKKINDSLFNKAKIKKISDLENQYEFDKEKQKLEAEQSKKEAVFREEAIRLKIIRNSLILGFTLVIIFALYTLRSFFQKRKANVALDKQKTKIESKNKKLSLQKTQIQNQTEELRMINEKLRELDKFKEEMTEMIVHDLKNPLNSIIGLAENEIVRQSGKSMLNMVSNILDVQKYENVEIKIHTSKKSIYNISKSALLQVNLLYKQKSIILNNQIQNYNVNADREIIERVFINILTNAIKYTPNNGTINLWSELTDSHIKISINDTGLGIPKDKLDVVFGRFEQVIAKRAGAARSTGIGLTFCKLFVEAHKGEIGVESELGSGTTFWFTLPTAKQSDHKDTEKSETNIFTDKYPKKKVLLKLSEKDKGAFKPYLFKLKELEVYESTDIEDIIKQIDFSKSKSLTQWKSEMENALYVMNEEKYSNLISIVE